MTKCWVPVLGRDPLWEDLGYHGEVTMSLGDSLRSMADAAKLMSAAYREFHDKYVDLPADLKHDPAPDWR